MFPPPVQIPRIQGLRGSGNEVGLSEELGNLMKNFTKNRKI